MTDWRNRIKETRTVRVEDIQPHPANWRRHPQAQESAIRGLLAQVGIVAPLVAYESEQYGGLVLLDGHLRQETGGEWPCVVLDVSDSEADIILASFDPITGLAEMDTGALAELLGRVDMQAIEDDGLAGLLEELATASGMNAPGEPVDAEPQVDRAEELRQKWGVEPGDLWLLDSGKGHAHRLICGDCTDAAVVGRVLDGERANICFTSPPYNAGKTPTEEKLGTERKYKDYSDDLPTEGYLRMLVSFTDIAMSVSDYAFVNIQMLSGNKLAIVDYLAQYRTRLSDIAIWDKQHAQPAMAENVMNSRFEFVLVLSATAPATRHLPGSFRGTVDNVYVGSPQRANDLGSGVHAATMPVDFAAWVVGSFTDKTAIVYEPFSGSGTTIIAAENLGRRCYACEIDAGYVAVALERFATATGVDPVRVEA